MSIFEVIQRGNAFVLATTGVQGEPDVVRLFRKAGKTRTWSLMYHFSVFYPEVARDGGVVDGGEYILNIDDQTGEVTVVPIP